MFQDSAIGGTITEVEVYATDEIGATKSKTTHDLRVGTYNLAAGKKPIMSDLKRNVEKEAIDIIGFQEVDLFMVRNPFNMLKQVSDGVYEFTVYSGAEKYLWADYGLGTASKYLVESTEIRFLETLGKIEKRILQRTVVDVNGKKVAFYNTHLSYEKDEIRMQQLQDIKEIVDADATEYKIIVGDFNTGTSHNELDMFRKEYSIAHGQEGNWLDTFNGEDSDLKVFLLIILLFSKI